MADTATTRTKVFISYSHNDTKHLTQLKKFLITFERQGLIDAWSDQRIGSGQKWFEEIEKALGEAQIAILLISQDFLASDFIHKYELPQMLQAAEKDGLRILPVLLDACTYKETPLADFQMVRLPGKSLTPLSRMKSSEKNELWVQVALDVKNIYNGLNTEDEQVVTEQSPPPSAPVPVPLFPTTPVPSQEPDEAEFMSLYREKVLNDADIAKLQMFGLTHDMMRPLPLSAMYIDARISQDNSSFYKIRSEQRDNDPLKAIQKQRFMLEQRAGSATTPVEAIKKHKRCVILGDPGAGKTTLLKAITVKSLAGSLTDLLDLPIYISLHAFAKTAHTDLFDFMLHMLQNYGIERSLAAAVLRKRLEAGNVLLLLDALDETVIGGDAKLAEASYQQVVEAIKRFLQRYDKISIMVTARKAGYRQRVQMVGFYEFEILDFLPEDIERFIRNWFELYGDQGYLTMAQELIAKLDNRPRIATLAANPLLLSLIVLTYQFSDQQLPENRSQLYQKCIDVLLTVWDAKRDIHRYRGFDVEAQKLLLTTLAEHFHKQGLRYFPKDEVLDLIGDILEDGGKPRNRASDVLNEIASENGLLREQAQDVYGFLHLTFQEYFAAQAISGLDQLLTHLGDPWWEEVTLLYAGKVRDAAPLLEALLDEHAEGAYPEDIFRTKLLQAGRCLATLPNIRGANKGLLRDTILGQLFELLLQPPYAWLRQEIAEILVQIGRAFEDSEIQTQVNVNQRLLAIMANEELDKSLRDAILEALGTYGFKKLGSRLFSLYINKKIRGVYTAYRTLSRLCDYSLLLTMVTYLEDNQHYNEQCELIIDLIVDFGDTTITPRLLKLLEKQSSFNSFSLEEGLIDSLILALGNLGDTSAIPMLQRLYYNPNFALSCFTSLLKLDATHYISEFLAILADPSVNWANKLALAMANLNLLADQRVFAAVLRLCSDPNAMDVQSRATLASIVAKLGKPEINRQLIEMLLNDQVETSIRSSIVTGFGNLNDASILPTLQQLYTSPDLPEELRDALLGTLVSLKDCAVVSDLLERLKKHSSARRIIDTRDAITPIIQCLTPPNTLPLLVDIQLPLYFRQQLARQLADTGDTSIVPALLDIVSNPIIVQEVRANVTYAIGQLAEDEQTVQRLVDLLPTSDIPEEISRALWSICRRAGVTAVKAGMLGSQLKVVHRQ